VAVGRADGTVIGEAAWPAGHRHGETLLPAIERVLGEHGIARSTLRGIVVGTGPGTFTGLRVGLATAKALAHGLGIPIAGIATSGALLEAAASTLDRGSARATTATGGLALLVPAGPQDRVLVVAGHPLRLAAGEEPELPAGATLVAVDLAGRAPDEACALGDRALAGLGAALLRLGARRLAETAGDDLAGLVPEYVTLPRGIERESGAVTWSHDPR
jgi:tRNA threonylcarbamoyladenosine biosynthesis protein TsaB